eukprot:jgi/Tetstr1/466653/TSEL_011141.t1
MSPVEVRASTHSALELLMSGRRTPATAAEEGAGPAAPRTPGRRPPSSRRWLVILLNLYASSLATGLPPQRQRGPACACPGPRSSWSSSTPPSSATPSCPGRPACSAAGWTGRGRPWYHRAPWRHAFPLRWLYDGFSRAELHFICGTAAGLLVAFAASGQMVLPY